MVQKTQKALKEPRVKIKLISSSLSGGLGKNGEVNVGHAPLFSLVDQQDFPCFSKGCEGCFLAVLPDHVRARNALWKGKVHRIPTGETTGVGVTCTHSSYSPGPQPSHTQPSPPCC